MLRAAAPSTHGQRRPLASEAGQTSCSARRPALWRCLACGRMRSAAEGRRVGGRWSVPGHAGRAAAQHALPGRRPCDRRAARSLALAGHGQWPEVCARHAQRVTGSVWSWLTSSKAGERRRLAAPCRGCAPLLAWHALGRLRWRRAAAAHRPARCGAVCAAGCTARLERSAGARPCWRSSTAAEPAAPAPARRRRRPRRAMAGAPREARDRGLLWRLSKRRPHLLPVRHAARRQAGLERARPAGAPRPGAQRRAGAGDRPHRPARCRAAQQADAPRAGGRRRRCASGCRRRPSARLPAARGAERHCTRCCRLTTLTLLEARWLGLDAAFAQEQMLAAAARAPPGGASWRWKPWRSRSARCCRQRRSEAQALIEQSLRAARGPQRAPRAGAPGGRPGRPATWRRWNDYAPWCECVAPTKRARLHAPPQRRAQPAAGRWHRGAASPRAGASLPRSARCT